jgi:hypothetical protein
LIADPEETMESRSRDQKNIEVTLAIAATEARKIAIAKGAGPEKMQQSSKKPKHKKKKKKKKKKKIPYRSKAEERDIYTRSTRMPGSGYSGRRQR